MSGASLPASLPAWPDVDFAAFGPVEARPVPRMQALTAAFLARNWTAIPHVTHHDEADVTGFEARRTAWNARPGATRLSPVVPLIKVLAAALAAFPAFNTSLDPSGRTQIWKGYFHVGVATETPGGLLVPVIRDCDTKGLAAIASELSDKAARARAKGLPMAEMSGGSITISSLGAIGGTAFTPIVNAPEVAILGVCPAVLRPAPAPGGGIAWLRMLPLSLSYDHRVINGADAARFVAFIAQRLDDPALFEA